jgi:hypothetical protein
MVDEFVNIAPQAESQEGTHLVFSVQPDLPYGLNMTQEDGVITGKASKPCDQTTYTITASNKSGEKQTKISFAIVEKHERVPVVDWTRDMVRKWLQQQLNPSQNELLQLDGMDGKQLVNCTDANAEPLLSMKFPEARKSQIASQVEELCCGLVSLKRIQEVLDKIGATSSVPVAADSKLSGNLESLIMGDPKHSLIMGDPAHSAMGIEVFMNVDTDEKWFSSFVADKQIAAIEAEVSKLAIDLRAAKELASAEGLETDVFSRHLHYLTLFGGIKDSLEPVGENRFLVVDVEKLQASLEELTIELVEFFEYVVKEDSSEKAFPNGVRDKGRGHVNLDFFVKHEKAKQCKLR